MSKQPWAIIVSCTISLYATGVQAQTSDGFAFGALKPSTIAPQASRDANPATIPTPRKKRDSDVKSAQSSSANYFTLKCGYTLKAFAKARSGEISDRIQRTDTATITIDLSRNKFQTLGGPILSIASVTNEDIKIHDRKDNDGGRVIGYINRATGDYFVSIMSGDDGPFRLFATEVGTCRKANLVPFRTRQF